MMTRLGKRKTWKAGNSLVTSLPKVWCLSVGIDENNSVKMKMNEKGWLIIRPVGGKLDGSE